MDLSKDFSIDLNESWVGKHNKEVMSVIEAYNADNPIRVPLLMWEWFGQHGYGCNPGKRAHRFHADVLQQGRFGRQFPLLDKFAVDLHDDRLSYVTAGWQRVVANRLEYSASVDHLVQDLTSLLKLLWSVLPGVEPGFIAIHHV